jgi:hypothetical protein
VGELTPFTEGREHFSIDVYIFGEPLDHGQLNFAIMIDIPEVIFVHVRVYDAQRVDPMHCELVGENLLFHIVFKKFQCVV